MDQERERRELHTKRNPKLIFVTFEMYAPFYGLIFVILCLILGEVSIAPDDGVSQYLTMRMGDKSLIVLENFDLYFVTNT
jgi:hypothetical protein